MSSSASAPSENPTRPHDADADTASVPPVSADAESSESDGGNVSEGGSKEPFSNLKLDERHFEDSKKREAKLVMGPPLGGPSQQDQVVEGETIAENEQILADLPDDALDLELTHLRLRTLRGLGLERFTKVQVSERVCSLLFVRCADPLTTPSSSRQRISLRQNLLTSLSYLPLPPLASSSALVTADAATTPSDAPRDELDEDELDDEDAAKKEAEYPYDERRRESAEETVWPLRDLKELEELDLYDNSLKSVKGLEGLDAIT